MHEQLALIGPSFPENSQPQKIKTSFPQIAVDGGIHFSSDPILWVGDGDSCGSEIEKQTRLPLTRKTSQDETDLRFCLDQIQSWNWKQLHLYGFLGHRQDQEWANLGEVCQELKKRGQDSRVLFYGKNLKPHVYFFSSGCQRLNINGFFSVFVLEEARVSLQGECQYPLQESILLPFSGRGISNRGRGEVEIWSSAPVLVILGDHQ